jgi:cytochrome c-type biogenesis protein CcmH/NrfG
MNRTFINRLTETLALLCVAAAIAILVYSARVPAVEGSLADLKVQVVSDHDMARFHVLLQDARRLTDTNRNPDAVMEELKESFPGRHEVWALAARHWEAQGHDGEALFAYARAVRLQPDYLDEGSGLFLGKRIEMLTAKVMDDLDTARSSRDLDNAGKQLLKTAYFLKRRLAGGCE